MRPWYEPGEDTAYGFLTRGCIRNCWFCKVPRFEGRLRVCDTVQNVVGDFKKAVLMDNNLLAYDGAVEAMRWLADHKVRADLNQGLDFRLVNDENMEALSQVKPFIHTGYTFAFDDVSYESALERAMPTIKRWIPKPWGVRLYCYFHPDSAGGLAGLVHRTEWCRRHECLPYIMRDSACWSMQGAERDFLWDLVSWCNQPHMWKCHPFEEFLSLRYHEGSFYRRRKEQSLMLFDRSMGVEFRTPQTRLEAFIDGRGGCDAEPVGGCPRMEVCAGGGPCR